MESCFSDLVVCKQCKFHGAVPIFRDERWPYLVYPRPTGTPLDMIRMRLPRLFNKLQMPSRMDDVIAVAKGQLCGFSRKVTPKTHWRNAVYCRKGLRDGLRDGAAIYLPSLASIHTRINGLMKGTSLPMLQA